MMSVTVWASLTVDEYFKDYNWSGQQVNLPSDKATSEAVEQTPWLWLKVDEFFHQHNWSGQAIARRSVDGQYGSSGSTANYLLMPVGQFFQLGDWREGERAAVVSKPPSKSEFPHFKSEKYNLNDLSDLF